MTKEEVEKQKQSIMNIIDRLDTCISTLEITANCYFSPSGEELKVWNTLLSSRDKIVKIRDSYWGKWDKVK